MLIFIEGPDGSGKTTLTKQFTDIGFKLMEPVDTFPDSPDRIKLQKYYDILKEHARSNEHYVADRSPLSDILYRIFDSKQPIMQLADFINLFEHASMYLIFCDTDASKDNAKNDENPVVTAHYDILRNLYKFAKSIFIMNDIDGIFSYDYTKNVPLDLIKEMNLD